MQSQTTICSGRAPICSVLSIVAPFASVVVYLIARETYQLLHPHDERWLAGFGFVGISTLGCFFGGLFLAGAAALRDEKYSIFRWIGFLLNAAPFVYFVVA